MREDLRTFIVERLLDLDPTLSDSAGSAIYSKVVDPLIARLGTDPLSVDVQEFILSRLQDEYPNADYRSPGSALRDLFVSPLVMLLEPLRAEIDFLRKQRSVNDAATLTEEELDAILENVFALRKNGTYSLAVVRMYFSVARAFSVDGSVIFSTAAGTEFLPQQPLNFLANQFNRTGNLYYVDVPVRSVLASAGSNVAIGEIRFVRNIESVVRVTNLAPSTGGVTRETNDEFVVRAERAISERSLNTQRGVETNIRNTFEDIVSVDVVGYGDPEMQRDILQGTSSVEVELPGPLLFTTANFETVSLAAGLPITNKVTITDPTGALQVAPGNFLRVSDLNGQFTDPLLSRPRKISAANYANGQWTVTLADFSAFLFQGNQMFSLLDQGVSNGNSTRLGFNQYARQGSGYRLFATNNGTDYLIGAPLPFDEAVTISAFDNSGPPDVIPGRDFLIVQSPPGSSGRPAMARCYPIHSRPVSGILALSRLDSFLTDKRSIFYQGKELYTHPAGISTTLESEGVHIVAFGAPAYDRAANDPARYDGKAVASYGRAPGVGLGPAGTPPADRTIQAEGSVLRWDTLGAQVGDYIAVALYSDLVGLTAYAGELSASYTQLLGHAWGRITTITPTALTVTGLDYEVLPSFSGFRLAWAIYRNEYEAIAPDGSKVTSYSDQTLVPAFRVPIGQNSPTHHPYTATYLSSTAPDSFSSLDPVNRAQAWRSYNNDSFKVAWIRLEQNFTAYLAGVGEIASKACLTATQTLLNSSDLPNDFDRHRYSMLRFGLTPTNVPGVHVWSALTSPLVDGSRFVSDPTGYLNNPSTISIGDNPAGTSNPRGNSGFLLPAGLSQQPSVKQVLQAFAPADTTQSVVGGIVVSGIPSSIPLPDLLPAPQVVESDKVHIGGMTDVYVKPSSSSQDQSDPIKIQPSDLAAEVLAEGADGAVVANALTILSSPSLDTALRQLLGIGANDFGGADNLVVELLNPPEGLTPTSFRLLHNTGSGAKIDGAFSKASAGLRWRLIRDCSVNLRDPVIVYKSGTDLKMAANSTVASSTGGFGVSLSSNLLLRVLTGPNAGEYAVTSIAANDVTVSTVFPFASEGATYQLVIRQASGLSMPLIRLTSVNLSGNQTGVTVPYRHPVDTVSSSFAGVNDDPFTSATGILEKVAGVLQLRSTTSFQSKGVVVGDVVRLEDVAEPHKYYRVIATPVQPNLQNQYILELDRVPVNDAGLEVFVGILTGVEFTVGHPSIGTASMLFMDSTFLEVDGSTVFRYTDAAGRVSKFRPTTQESAVVYQTGQTEVGFDVTKVGAQAPFTYEFSSTSVNFLGLGLRAGDRIEFLTKVLRSGAHASSSANLAIVGKELVLEIDDVRYVVVMTGAVNTTITGAVNDINNQTGGRVLAQITQISNDFFLDIVSNSSVSILAESSFGLLGSSGALKLDVTNNLLGAYPVGVVQKVEYLPNTDSVKVTVETVVPDWTPPASGIGVSIRARRNGVQRVYPSEMTLESTGLYSATIKLSSYEPFTRDLALSQQSMQVEGYRSFGYELVTGNDLYSYSVAEQPFIKVSPVVLPDTADSLDVAYPLPGSLTTLSYEWAPTVSAVQSYMLQPFVRVANHNPLVRHFLPAYPVINIQYRGPTTLTADVVLAKVQEYLGSLYPNRPLELFDLVTVLERAGATFVQFPQQAAFLTYDANRTARLIRSDNVIRLDRRYHVMESADMLTIEAI
jgi:hypothetical protein